MMWTGLGSVTLLVALLVVAVFDQLKPSVQDITAIVQIYVGLGLLAVAVYGVQQVRQSVLNGHMKIVMQTRGEWIAVAQAMMDHPKLTMVYANSVAKEKLKNKSDDELREYAFATRLCEIVAYHWCLGQQPAVARCLESIYPENIAYTSQRVYEIWEHWGLKHDFPAPIQDFISTMVFTQHAKAGEKEANA